MTLEELADLLGTPLPGPYGASPEDIAGLSSGVRSAAGRLGAMLPSVPRLSLPTASPAMQSYMLRRGLVPDEVRAGLTPESQPQSRFGSDASLLTPEQMRQLKASAMSRGGGLA